MHQRRGCLTFDCRPLIVSVTIGHAIFIFTHHACIESVFRFSENSDWFALKQALWFVKRGIFSNFVPIQDYAAYEYRKSAYIPRW